MTKRLAIGTVLYHPDKATFERINFLIENDFPLFIFDNTPNPEYSLKNELKESKDITLIHGAKNFGLGIGLSLICSNAYFQGFEYLFFLDQDTSISGLTLSFIEKVIIEIRNIEQFAIIQFKNSKNSDESPIQIQETDLTISSGSLFNLKNLNSIGGHNETYFVESVDYEISIRSIYNGFKIGTIDPTPDFDHETYQADSYLEVLKKKIRYRKHNPRRLKDSVKSYFKILIYCIQIRSFRYFYLVIKSFLIYLYGQIFSNFIIVFNLKNKTHEM